MLQYAVLTLLHDGADHGYRLKQRLDRFLGPVWQVNVGQVYQVLDRLRRERWVEELPPETDRDGGHERWPVAITREGRTELARWRAAAIRTSRPPGPARNEILGRLAIGGDGCIEEVLAGVLRERSSYCEELLQIAARCRAHRHAESPVESAKLLALEACRLVIEAHIEWLDLCLTHLRATPPPQRDAAADHRLPPDVGGQSSS